MNDIVLLFQLISVTFSSSPSLRTRLKQLYSKYRTLLSLFTSKRIISNFGRQWRCYAIQNLVVNFWIAAQSN